MPARFDDVQPFAALKRPAVESLARLLYMKASTTTSKTNSSCEQWLTGQKRQIRQMQDVSIRRQGTLSIVADVFRGELTRPQETIQALETASLCDAHGELNPLVLSALMKLLTEETTLCTDRFRKYRDKATIQKQDPATVVEGEMNPAIKFWLDSISMIPALWMGKTRWEQEMQRPLTISLPVCARYHGCVACKLAVVGGSVQFLMDLRTSLLVRKEYEADMQGVEDEKDVQSPLLLRMVEAWVDMCYAVKKRHFIRQESEMLSPMVVALWGEISAKKLAKRKGLKRGRDSRMFTNSGWPMPLAPLMEVDALAFERLCNGADEVEERENEEDEEDGVVAGRRRKNMTTKPREGYSHCLPEGLLSVDILVKDEAPLGRLHNGRKKSTTGTTLSKSRLPRNNLSRLQGNTSSSVSREPWNSDYRNYILAGSVPPTEAGLSTIYGLYGNGSTDAWPVA
ncbi:hypothetical protein NQ176_g10084 [Zarea fungicola]|uniref:Uncharacterized protein n=1 Tax=Zarea fungicola TaxID=93591 RepID=A0ACC1MJ56_9HYPO|nr:hypothetical protein NQ176_g10084 [Lecanicillium fungicola]